jgi:preprotein translocase subunit SecE
VDDVSEAERPRERTPLPEFLREVRAELRRVNWPNRQQIVSYTIVVLVVTLFVTTFTWGADEGIRRIVLNMLG